MKPGHKAKGVQKSAIKNKTIHHQIYKHILDDEISTPYPNVSFRSELHQVKTITTKKAALKRDEKTRVFCTKTLSYAPGHYILGESNNILNELIDSLIMEVV